jgi:hypothetical protein
MVAKMARYWLLYPPRGGSEKDRPNPVRLDATKDLVGWTPERVGQLGWKIGAKYDNKEGTYLLGQLANIGDWSQDEGVDGSTPPLATEIREFMCIGVDGSVFFYRLNARRDTGQGLKLCSTYVMQSSSVPCLFNAVVTTRKSDKGEVFYGASLQKVGGVPVPESVIENAIHWNSLVKVRKVVVNDAGETVPF